MFGDRPDAKVQSHCKQAAVFLEKMESVVSRLVFSGKKSPKYLRGRTLSVALQKASD
jgi:hypothetical protein